MSSNIPITKQRPLLQVQNLLVQFAISTQRWFAKSHFTKAVDAVSFELDENETLGLVGESGCGKSSLARALLRLVDPTSGTIVLEGTDITHLTAKQMRPHRQSIQGIFQDPIASLNPRMTVGDIIAEPLRIFSPHLTKTEIKKRVMSMMDRVGLRAHQVNHYPHQFSGGQCQRIGIARALISQPHLVICDEPVSALDVSIKAQIINLLSSLQRELGLSILFISHDLATVKHICDRVMVMYLGKIVEINQTHGLFEKPQHPYTQALIEAIPQPHPDFSRKTEYQFIHGEIPSAINPPSGCRFHPRCPLAIEKCRNHSPRLLATNNGTMGRTACHLAH